MGHLWLHLAAITTLWIVAELQKALGPQLDPGEFSEVRKRCLQRCIRLLAVTVVYCLVLPHL